MNLHNINTIARYEVKLLRRGWLFRIFSILALLGISGGLLYWQTNLLNPMDTHWPRIALSSLMPFVSVYLYNIAQSIIVIFLAGNFLKRDKKLDTAEVIYVRPMSNADYIIGKTWGITKVFLSLNAITLAITAFFNVAINHSPFSLFPYLFYLFSISLPSLIFVLGLSFTIMCLFKNQAITFVLMLGIIGTVFFKLSTTLYGVFDFFGVNIPTIFSDVTGHIDLTSFLLQRAIFLLAGVGFICFTIALVKRLPHKPWKIIIVNALGGFFLFVACICGCIYVLHYGNQMDSRRDYIASFNKYTTAPQAHIAEHDLTITPQGERLEGKSILKITNQNRTPLEQLILYLNPALEIQSIEANQQAIPFERDHQVILINHPLKSHDSLLLTLNYVGGIDELICYTDISDTTYLDNSIDQVPYQFGKRYAWLEDSFTLLTPECIWYPVAIPPVNPASPYQIQKDFTQYKLTVNYSGDKIVLSQGESLQENGKIIFNTSQPLPGISLTIADYEKKSLRIDSVEYAILYFKGHDYFSKHFSRIQDTLPGIIRELKNDIEIAKGRDYPFQKFILAETPAQFATYIRNWKGYTEYIMPEIVFIPERGISLGTDFDADKNRRKTWRRPGQDAIDETEMEMEIFRTFIQIIFMQEKQLNWFAQDQMMNPFNIAPQFFNHTNFIYSEDYPMMDIVLNIMQNTSTSNSFRRWNSIINDEQRANLYLENHSFKTALSDENIKPSIFYELLKLKSKALQNYIHTQMPPEEFTIFLNKFFEKHQFANISFDLFTQELEEEYGIDLMPFIQSWYLEDHSPTLFIKDVDANQVVIEEVTKYQIKFKINNPSDINAIITTDIQQGGSFMGGPRGGGGFGGSNAQEVPETYIIPAQQAREIKMIVDERPASVRINTNISHNLPSSYTYHFPKIETTVTDTLVGIFPISPEVFKPDFREIIIDNEDVNFKTIESNNRNKLKDLFQEEQKEKYRNFNPWWGIPSKWSAIAADYCYGETVCSAVYKKKGSGNNSVQWIADIPQSGYYEISVWNTKQNMLMMRARRGREQEERNQTYTISFGEEKESITIDLEREESGWISFGNFYLPKGKTTITLTDKVSGRYVIADAVKFTRVDE